jgi:hypothetical protein
MGTSGAEWQYHSRSDRHSKVACWGVLLDLLATSGLLRDHVTDGKVVFGVNHSMHDFVNDQRKDLDLVIARPGEEQEGRQHRTFAELGGHYGVVLEDQDRRQLEQLPDVVEGAVGSVLIALEAKACMTEHGKARPRLYDELNSSHQIVHSATNQALAVGFVMINACEEFFSPNRNQGLADRDREPNSHPQPRALQSTLDKVAQLPRRSDQSARGYDGLGIVVVDMRNDGTPVHLVTDPPAPQPGDLFHYDSMIRRVAAEYDSTFRRI